MPSFQVDDRVRCMQPYDGNDAIVGLAGTVRDVHSGNGTVGVEFDGSFTDGHNLGGRIASYRGWWCDPEVLVPLSRAVSTVQTIGQFLSRYAPRRTDDAACPAVSDRTADPAVRRAQAADFPF